MTLLAAQDSLHWVLFLCVVFCLGCADSARNEGARNEGNEGESRQGESRQTVAFAKSGQAPDTDSKPANATAVPSDVLAIAPGVSDQALVAPLADAYRRVDPSQDGWQSEVVGSAVQSQLNQIGNWLTTGKFDGGATWEGLCDAKLRTKLVPDDLTTEFQDGVLSVRRGSARSDLEAGDLDRLSDGPTGAGDLRTELQSFARRFRSERAAHVKFKVVRVEQPADGPSHVASTLVYLHADGLRSDSPTDVEPANATMSDQGGRTEITSTWRCRWDLSKKRPRLIGLMVEDCEVVTSTGPSNPIFVDCTEALFAHVPAYQNQLLYGTDYWRGRLCRDLGLDVVANHGLAMADVNGDMLEDIYLCQQGGLPNRLFLRESDGTLRDASLESGADWLDYSASALLLDFDNNGTRDLIVSQETRVLLMSNDGEGRFELIGEMPTTAQVFSMASCDFDQDGDLDIYVCGYNPLRAKARTGAMGEPIPYHDARNGGQNMLLRNDGNWLVTNVIDTVGMGENNNRFSFAASWEDYDNDGDFDIYVANDYGRNNLYRNEDGQFRDVAASLGVEDMSAGMAISWADFNRDGWMDFYVSNMFSAAGNRITYQRQFKATTADDRTKQEYQRHARGNSLFSNIGGQFRDESVASRTTMGRWAWGNQFIDINNDGWEDLVVANGFISTHDTGDL